jgi:hypothetical protein
MVDVWDSTKQGVQERKRRLDSQWSDQSIAQAVNAMNTNIARYTQDAGISRGESNQFYTAANQKFVQLADGMKEYVDMNRTLTQGLRGLSDNSDVKSKLEEVGRLKQQIVQIEKDLVVAKQEFQTSTARQANAEQPNVPLSFYQGFGGKIGFNKPLRTISIPFLVVFSFLFLIFSALILREFFTPAGSTYLNNTTYQEGGIFAVFTDSRFYTGILVVVFVTIFVAVLSYRGYFGKRLGQ